MKILAVDTSTQTCSVALIDGADLIAETTTGLRQTHTKHLLGNIVHLLAEAGWRTEALDGMAVVQGPGSFTGLRIGISSIKGLAAATGKPVVGVSSLEALAWQCLAYNGRIYPMIDARRTEVYTAGFLAANGHLNPLAPQQVAAPAKVMANIEAPCLMVGNGALLYGDMIREHLGSGAHFAPAGQHHVRASTVAYMAWQRFKQGDVVKNGQLVPEYVRKSDAEIHLNLKKVS